MAITLDSNRRTRAAETTTETAKAPVTAKTNSATGFAGQDNFDANRSTVTSGPMAAVVDGGGGGGSGPVDPQAPVEFQPVATPEPTPNNPPPDIGTDGERLSDDQLEETLWGVGMPGIAGDALANRLGNPEGSDAAKMQILQEVFAHPEQYAQALTNFSGDPRNVAYDEMQVVASAVGDAYRAGQITDEQLHDMMEEMGPEESAYFMGTLATDPDNTGVGGVVEAAAEQAEALGYEQTAALGFTSSQALIDAHLPSDSAQQDAFNQVLEFTETAQEYNGSEARPDAVAVMANAVGNLARLSANGNGFTQDEFAQYLNDFEPGYGMGDSASFANEVLARMRVTPGDTEPGGAVELLGKASEQLVQTADEDERAQWDATAQTAYTSSDALIEANLSSPERREHAFSVLTRQANELHDEAREAAENDPPYNLLEQPAVVDGVTRLMAQHGEELLDKALDNPDEYGGAAELTKFFENTLFSTYATEEQRGRVEDVLNQYVEASISQVNNDGVAVGQNVGKLLSIVERAGQEAVERAGDVEQEKSLVGGIFNAVITKLGSTLAASAVTALTGGNALAGGLAGTATGALLSGILGKEPDPATLREDLEAAFVRQLEAGGGDIHAGEVILGQLNQTYAAVSEDLNDQRDDLRDQVAAATDPAERQRLQDQLSDLEDEIDTLDQTYTSIQTSYEFILHNGQLTDELEEYDGD